MISTPRTRWRPLSYSPGTRRPRQAVDSGVRLLDGHWRGLPGRDRRRRMAGVGDRRGRHARLGRAADVPVVDQVKVLSAQGPQVRGAESEVSSPRLQLSALGGGGSESRSPLEKH